MKQEKKQFIEAELKKMKAAQVGRAIMLVGLWALMLATFWTIIGLIVFGIILYIAHRNYSRVASEMRQLKIQLLE